MDENQRSEQLNPWLYIWIKPRAVIRQELEKSDRERHFILLALLIGIPTLFTSYELNHFDVNYGFIIGISLIVGPIASLIMLYLSSWISAVVGRWIGGNGRAADLRVATMRGWMIPSLATLFISFIDFLLRGDEYFISPAARTEPREIVGFIESLSSGMNSILVIPYFIVSIWVFVIYLKSIGEAHNFSAWMSLLMTIIIVALIFIPLVFIVLLFTAVFAF
ncbi:YIP1 family protein [Alkalicoccobacillus porphyridii]|uniref:Yip1 domain-containing protein n=1 Tax=Alkalicoccobacillus porphyridii TaxID=2597270 RepID=A0A554A1X2_9BACI|nr:YIP1 family protein [Alkalicoccobacillus porphyridii]TSB47669.1 hypothetical protein FN960_03890 [Alkalicoccobacillus porphyridii]